MTQISQLEIDLDKSEAFKVVEKMSYFLDLFFPLLFFILSLWKLGKKALELACVSTALGLSSITL